MSTYVSPPAGKRKRLFYYTGALCVLVLVTTGIFAKNGWFPSTDPLSGRRSGWFGKPLKKDDPSAWNPIAPDPTPTPVTLSRELIYAGSRLLTQVDANAQEVPPSDLAIWRPASGEWWILNGSANGSYSTYSAGTWGTNGDRPEPGDFDGDGKTDFAIYRPSTGVWWINESSSGSTYNFSFGNSSDVTVPGDYDGDGKTDAAVFRQNDPSSGYGTFYIRRYDGSYYAAQFGLATDKPTSGDFDGDGKADIAVWRDSNATFYSLSSSNGSTASFSFSTECSGHNPCSTEPVPADYDGDGKADYSIRLSGSSNWIIRNSGSSTTDTISWQNAGDMAVQNDYDGDGKCDIAVWRDSTGYWYIRLSTNTSTIRSAQWGASGDTPEPAYFRR